MPKGFRHGFGVNAFQAGVPPHLVQRWRGHADLRTTAIYGEVIGPEERTFAARMWTKLVKRYEPSELCYITQTGEIAPLAEP